MSIFITRYFHTSTNTTLTKQQQLWQQQCWWWKAGWWFWILNTEKFQQHTNSRVFLEYQAGPSLSSTADLSDEVKTQTTQTLQGEPRPSFGPCSLSRGQGHWRNSRKNVVQALLLIPASPANLIYNMNSWIAHMHANTHTHTHTIPSLWDWLSGSNNV